MRVDTAAYTDCVIPPYYDSLVAKLIVYGQDRPEALARLGESSSEVIGVLIEALLAREKPIRVWAVQALSDVGTPAVTALLGLLTHKQTGVRQSVAQTLGEIGDDSARDALYKALKDPDANVRAAAMRALGEIRVP